MERTFQQAVDRWLKRRTEMKWHQYEVRYTKVLLDHFGADTPLSQITRGPISEFRDDMLDTRKPATVNRYLNVLRAILVKARDDWEWLERIPKIDRMKEEGRAHYLSREQARRLIELLPGHLAQMVTFALCTGLRSSNIRELRWDEVSDGLDHIEIPASKMKAGKDFSAPLNKQASEVLRQQRGLHPEWVFPYHGGPVTQCNTRAFREACRRAGVPGTRFHDLRHTFASWHVQAGTHQAKLRELGGWQSDKMVQRYAHLDKKKHLKKEAETTVF